MTSRLVTSIRPSFQIPYASGCHAWDSRTARIISPDGSSYGKRRCLLRRDPPVFLNAATKAFRDPPFNLSGDATHLGGHGVPAVLGRRIDLNQYPLSDLPVFSREDVAGVLDGDPYLGAAPSALHRDFQNPRSVKYNVAVEYGLTGKMVAGLQWMRHHTSQLHGQRNYNLPPSEVRLEDRARIPFYDVGNRPAPLLGPVYVTESIGRADYHGVTANWKYRGERIQLVAHYTYARAYSSDINEGYFWGPLYTDQARPEDAYGPSDLDLRHQVTAHTVLRIPGGFTWSAILRAASGPPFSPAAGRDLNGDQLSADRAMEAPARYFGRNSFRNRGMRNVDMRLLRQFSVSDTSRIELSLELFNALNFDNVEYGRFNRIYGPGLDLATGHSGRAQRFVSSPHGGRRHLRPNNSQVFGMGPFQVQLGVRFFF